MENQSCRLFNLTSANWSRIHDERCNFHAWKLRAIQRIDTVVPATQFSDTNRKTRSRKRAHFCAGQTYTPSSSREINEFTREFTSRSSGFNLHRQTGSIDKLFFRLKLSYFSFFHRSHSCHRMYTHDVSCASNILRHSFHQR